MLPLKERGMFISFSQFKETKESQYISYGYFRLFSFSVQYRGIKISLSNPSTLIFKIVEPVFLNSIQIISWIFETLQISLSSKDKNTFPIPSEKSPTSEK